MLILTLRTDKPEAEIGLYENESKLAYEVWPAHRELAETLHKKIEKILDQSSKSLKDIEGIVCYKGPGSFTGLRIGMSVANALAYSQQIPIVATAGDDWLAEGVKRIIAGENEQIVTPEYGGAAFTTKPQI